MTLQVTANKIAINNASGQEKFNSSQSLVFKKVFVSGSSVTLNSSAPTRLIGSQLSAALSGGDFPVFYITITSATGNGASSLLNIKQPASGSVFMHQSIVTSNNTSTVEFEYFSCRTQGTDIKFVATRTKHDGQPMNIATSVTFNWELYVYSVTQ